MKLSELIEKAGFTPQGYSGRGMIGRECLSVRIDGRDSKEFFATLIKYGTDLVRNADGSEGIVEGVGILDLTTSALRSHREDILGHGTVIYFPAAPPPEDEGDDEEPT